jgi:hypothetical protein
MVNTMNEDLRKAERLALLMQPNGDLMLIVKGVSYTVLTILNISPNGISLQINKFVDDNEEVAVHYKNKDMNLSVIGTVVWSSPGKVTADVGKNVLPYDIGINLISPHLLFSLMTTKSE